MIAGLTCPPIYLSNPSAGLAQRTFMPSAAPLSTHQPLAGPDPRLAAFVQRLRRFVLDERDAQRVQLEAQWARPLAERLAAGHAIAGVRFAGVTAGGLYEFECARNQSRFREGDLLCLHRSSPLLQPSFTLTLELDDETRLLALPDGPVDVQRLSQQPDGWLIDEGYLDLSGFVLDALDQAAETLIGREYVLPALLGLTQPVVATEPYERAAERAAQLGLNERQQEALASAYATDSFWLVQGPPGTGKTRVLAHLAEALVSRGERVLVTAFTHRAINNALNTLARLAPETPVVKIGEARRGEDLQAVENAEYFDRSSVADSDGGYVVGATPFATQTKRLAGVTFDTVIFDEASQITLPLAVMGMLAGQRHIFFGDHKQLPPVLTRRYSAGAFKESVFETLAGRGFDTLLDETYRLNDALAAWPSAAHYEGRLRPANPAVAARRIEYARPVERYAEVLDPAQPKVFLDLGHRNTTTRNYQEAGVVMDLVLELLKAGVPAGEIGVVVPYRAQGRQIRSLLRGLLPEAEARRPLVVDTVERMQGQEREAVIVSLTTSLPSFAAGLADFFFQPERLNVAVTRPRSKLILVGSRHVLRAEPVSEEDQAAVELFRDLIAACVTLTLPGSEP